MTGTVHFTSNTFAKTILKIFCKTRAAWVRALNADAHAPQRGVHLCTRHYPSAREHLHVDAVARRREYERRLHRLGKLARLRGRLLLHRAVERVEDVELGANEERNRGLIAPEEEG
jgi:hypothetical protein